MVLSRCRKEEQITEKDLKEASDCLRKLGHDKNNIDLVEEGVIIGGIQNGLLIKRQWNQEPYEIFLLFSALDVLADGF